MSFKDFNFDLKQIRGFMEVVNEKSFTNASRNLKISQASISHQVGQLEKMLAASEIAIDISEEAVDLIAELGFDPQYGARPIRRVLQRKLVNELSKMILAGKVDRSKAIRVMARNGELVFGQ